MVRKSKYDPYTDIIREMMDAGCTYGQIEEELWSRGMEDADYSSIAYFCKCRAIKSRVTKGARDGRYIPHCEGCLKCIEVTNTVGKEERICTELLRIISRSTKTSPMECPKRREN